MVVRPFSFDDESDLDQTNLWRVSQGEQPLPREALPHIGFIVPGVAAGHLYLTDSCLGLVESFSTNPMIESDLRHEALEAVCHELMRVAKDLRITNVALWTTNPGILARAEAWGFGKAGISTMMTKEL